MLKAQQLKTALAKAKLIAVHGPWSRAVEFRHLHVPKPDPLWGGASKIHGARFTPQGGFDSIYLAWTSITALAEVQTLAFLAGGIFQPLTPPWVLMSVDGVVSGVLDLTDKKTLVALGTNEQEISGAWQTAPFPPTQMLAQVAYDSGNIVGIKYPSAKNLGGGINLVVFPDRLPLIATDYLEVNDPHGHLAQRIGA
jgi:RES domain-containing protein